MTANISGHKIERINTKMEIMSELLDRRAAAEYCGVTEDYLLNLAKHRDAGPGFIKPSPRKTLYARSALDRWMASWDRFEPKCELEP
jgi:hypothetical protein